MSVAISNVLIKNWTNIRSGRWLRGDVADYDEWAELVDDPRWSYEGMLPYFKKSEYWFSETENAEQHGHDGPIYVTSPSAQNRTYPLNEMLEESWHDVGVETSSFYDMNAGENLGLGELNENREDGRRQIANTKYSFDGVEVLTEQMVSRVVLNMGDGTPRATGVELKNGTKISGREVVVSAGAYRSPQILMLSGIGPGDQLEEHGIDVHMEAPDVGKHLSDHLRFIVDWRLRDPSKGYAVGSDNPLFDEPQYGLGGHAGYVTSTAADPNGLARAIEADEGESPSHRAHYLLRRKQATMETVVEYEVSQPSDEAPADGTHISSVMVALKPTSRGSVRIRSAKIDDDPIVDPNYFATEADRFAWREGVREIIEVMTGDTPLGRDIIDGETPPSGQEPLNADSTDDHIEARIRDASSNTYHPMGTCSMGKVVDSELRVLGIEGLRVADASIIPIAIGAHTQAATYALAEHAAAIILGRTD